MFRDVRLRSIIASSIFVVAFSAHAKDEAAEAAALASKFMKGEIVATCQPDLFTFEQYQQKMLEHFKTNLSVRGFDNNIYPLNQANRDVAKKLGFLWWYTQGYFVRSIEEAREHAKLFKKTIQDQFSVGLYFIGDIRDLGVAPDKKGNAVPVKAIADLFSRGAIELDYLAEDGTVLDTPRERIISGEDLLSRFDPKNLADPDMAVKLVSGNPRSYNFPYINIYGWHSSKFRGVIDHEDFVQSSSMRRIVQTYQDLYAHGYRFIFRPRDRAIKMDMIDVLKRTPRKKRMVINGQNVEVDLGEAINRHASGDVNYLLTDDTYMGVLLNPKGQVVGGEVGDIKYMTGESIGYDPERMGPEVPDLTTAAEIAAVYAFLNSLEQGLKYSSSGPMVTNFSYGIGARPYPLDRALAIFANTTQDESQLTENYEWNPFDAEIGKPRLETQFAKLRRTILLGAMTSNIFLGPTPHINPITIEYARKVGIEPGHIYVEFANTLAEARLSAGRSGRGTQTIYIVAPRFRPDISQPALAELKKVLTQGKIPEIGNQRDEKFVSDQPISRMASFKVIENGEGRHIHYYDSRLISDLDLDSGVEVSWAEESTGVMMIKGWVSIEKDPVKIQEFEKILLDQKNAENMRKNAEAKAKREEELKKKGITPEEAARRKAEAMAKRAAQQNKN